ncbi:MAG: hypothetical protein GQ549_01170 [Gammaproteobacteria bacterium]|nr:hypothetical protein [Gammaproteobacteria bacterium]
MHNTSTHTLKLLASLVWYSGALVLSFKSSRLLLEAQSINSNQTWILLAILAGIMIGLVKAKYLFKRVCIKNLKRIDALKTPKFWQAYRTHFYFFLLAMIILGSSITRLAHGNYAALITVAIIEISLATALITSSNCFWKKE